MPFIPREEPFTCGNCGFNVQPLVRGSYRSHCPKCLYSKHVDLHPGDRVNTCLGMMMPIGIDQDGKRGFLILQRCTRCAEVRRNRVAPDDDIVGFSHQLHNNG